LFDTPGVVVSAPDIPGEGLDLAKDGYGGVVVVWGQSGDVYAQRVDANGLVQWTSDGVPVAGSADDEGNPKVTYYSDVNGYVVTWQNATHNIRRNIPGGISFPLIGTSTDLTFTDENPNMTVGANYKVAAVDDNGNEGPYTPIFFVSPDPTGVMGDTPPHALRLHNPSPNPFAGSTSFGVGVPRDADDVAGRRVRREVRKAMTAGWHTLSFDGVDGSHKPLASGVYFYRVTMGTEQVTRKVVIAR